VKNSLACRYHRLAQKKEEKRRKKRKRERLQSRAPSIIRRPLRDIIFSSFSLSFFLSMIAIPPGRSLVFEAIRRFASATRVRSHDTRVHAYNIDERIPGNNNKNRLYRCASESIERKMMPAWPAREIKQTQDDCIYRDRRLNLFNRRDRSAIGDLPATNDKNTGRFRQRVAAARGITWRTCEATGGR